MSGKPLVVALDVGGHAVRALVYDGTGAVHARAERPVLTRVDGPRVEHDAEALADAVQAVLEEVCTGPDTGAERIVAVGLATQRSSIVCADRGTGRALTPAISWQDRRAASWLAAQAMDAAFVRCETGLPVSPHYGASKMRWCLDHVADVGAALAAGMLAIGPLSSFLTLRLCRGRPWLADPCNASRTLLWSLREQDWSDTLLGQFGIPRHVLPRAVPNRYSFGDVAVGGRSLPLAVVTGDQSAVPFALGEPDPGTVYVNLGTGAFLQRVRSGDTPPPVGLLRGVLWQDDDGVVFTDEGTVNGAGGAVQAIARDVGRTDGDVFAHLGDWLDREPSPPLFLNGVSGLGSPWWVAEFPSRFVGAGDFPARMVAVVESIAFLVQRNLDAWTAAGMPPRTLTLTGGLSRLDGLCRRIADLSTCPVLRPETTEATARGLAFLLAGRPGNWGTPGVRQFDSTPNAPLRARYEQWRALMTAEVTGEVPAGMRPLRS